MNKKRFVRGFAIGTILLATLVGFVVWSSMFYAPNVYALAKGDASTTDIMKKALTHNMRVCYDDHYMRTPLRSDKAKMGDGGYDTRYGHDNYMFYGYSTENLLPIPTLIGNTIKDSDVSCAQSIAGYNKSGQKMTGLLSLFGKPDFDGDGTGTNMVAMGYTPAPKDEDDQPQAGKHTFKISYTYQDTINNKLEPTKTGSISVTFGANGGLVSNPDGCYENNGASKDSSKMFCIDTANSNLQIFEGKLWGTVNALSYRNGAPYTWLAAYQISMDEGEIDFSGIPSWNQMQTDCEGQAVDDVTDLGNGFTVGNKFYACAENLSREFSDLKVEYKFEPDESQALTHEKFEITDFNVARQHFIDYLGATSYDSAWTANEKFTVYYSYYIARVKNDNKSNGYLSVDESSCVDSLHGGILAVGNSYYLPHNGKWCKINIDDKLVVQHKTVANDEGKFAILSGTQTKMTTGKDADAFREVVRELMQIHDQIDISGTGEIGDVPEPDPTPVDPNPQPTPEGSETPNCYNSASSLGWILCPVMDIVSRATQGAYDYVRDNFLEVKASMYSSKSPAHNVWKIIRNWGNIIFVILLLLVIFSQVTGIGLDNYSIKKVLPRLIMVVVLTNLSFIICQLAIDVSNILGVELENLFGVTFANQITTDQSFDLGVFLEGIIPTLFTLGSGAAFGAIIVATWDKWLVPLALFFLVTLIGVLFFAIMLAAREAAVIILAVLSPVAIACYALPNTKKLYDRWFKMFSSMLLLFPICGALMGGGIMASRLLLATASDSSNTVASIAAIPLKLFADLSGSGDKGFFFQLVAVLIQVVPFFFVPTLTRSAFAALGNLGNKIATFGSRLGNTAAGAIRGAEGTKDLQRRMNATEAARRARRYATNKDFRGRLGTWMNNRGLNGDGLLNSGGRARAQSRAISLANSEFIETGRARANAERGLTQDDKNRRDNLRENLRLQQEEEEIKTYADRYKVSGMATNDPVMEQEYENALTRLMENSEDRDAMAQLVAAQRILAKSDSGRKAMQNQLYRASNRVGTGNRNIGLQNAADRLLGESGGDIKARNRGFFRYLTDTAHGEVVQGTFSESTHNNDHSMRSSQYDLLGADKYSASALIGADETALIRLNEQVQAGNIAGSDLADLSSTAMEALNNPNITDLKPEVRRELENMADSYYLATDQTRNATNAAGVNIADARRMAATTSTDLDRVVNSARRGQYDQTMLNRMANVAERTLLESNQGNLSIAAGNRDRLRDIMQAAGRSTAAVDQGSSINVPHGGNGNQQQIILPGQPGYNAQTRLGNQGGQGPHIVT